MVLNIGIFGQKSNVFNGPLHFKDHAPCQVEHIRGGVVIEGAWSSVSHSGKFAHCTHSGKMKVRWDLVYYDVYTTKHERSQSDKKKSQCIPLSLASVRGWDWSRDVDLWVDGAV